MAKHQDLEILGGIAAGEEREQLDGAAQGQIGESGSTQGNLQSGVRACGRYPSSTRTRSSQALSQLTHPTGWLRGGDLGDRLLDPGGEPLDLAAEGVDLVPQHPGDDAVVVAELAG